MSGYTQIESDIPESPILNDSGAYTAAPSVTNGSIPQPAVERTLLQRLKESSHPLALLFYIFFRIAPIFMYLFGNLFLALITKESRFILHFIILVLLISADFWNLKNISGRLLVGLRWWNEITAKEGTSEFENVWVFETADPDRYINPIDSKVFWTLLYVQPVAWGVLGIMAVLKLELLYLILIVISISLSLTNAVAFTKCDKFGKANLMANDFFSKATTGVFSRFNPFA
ncbi:Golgi apparatus membrane protein TVP23 [Metschnikowia bicuspidata var. bicuspidata NRRL YB-4993]|uniref:Golgi apparatus membrane protein TVP23 n=1 Tax=Metschnikowia bicuspidata var. bicuspidata NRRL YB-4993 TaxID=869754 RepID=A0A1A0H822_9ASCO|nr:Golgi apparatus membrane protein TVP23 [Metschnikowia bicuspidata var. bicuspidata NRRL YB-4993]OBA20135.1 Golgi apparatus membrane protein TVP23 [Metschnikowia bicuspidata var. bicuspidata NRRL YB-4993]